VQLRKPSMASGPRESSTLTFLGPTAKHAFMELAEVTQLRDRFPVAA
jgi:hypothetical protein